MERNHTIKRQRLQAMKLADALNSIKGVPISDYAKKLSQQWADGEISGDEMKSLLSEHHRKLVSEENSI